MDTEQAINDLALVCTHTQGHVRALHAALVGVLRAIPLTDESRAAVLQSLHQHRLELLPVGGPVVQQFEGFAAELESAMRPKDTLS